MPRLRDSYLFGDYCSGTIWEAFRGPTGTWIRSTLTQTSLQISSFREDFAGELYVLDLRGGVYRFSEKLPTRHRAAGR